jgi:hypothetical protein
MYSTPPTKTSPVQKGENSRKVKRRNIPAAFLEKEEALGRVEYQGPPGPFLDRETFNPPEASTGLLDEPMNGSERNGS